MAQAQKDEKAIQKQLNREKKIKEECGKDWKGEMSPWNDSEIIRALDKSGVCNYACDHSHCDMFRNDIYRKCSIVGFDGKRITINIGYGLQSLGPWRRDLQNALINNGYFPY